MARTMPDQDFYALLLSEAEHSPFAICRIRASFRPASPDRYFGGFLELGGVGTPPSNLERMVHYWFNQHPELVPADFTGYVLLAAHWRPQEGVLMHQLCRVDIIKLEARTSWNAG